MSRSRRKRFVISVLTLGALIAGIIVYSFGPILPSIAHTWIHYATWRISAQKSYYRGWYDASRVLGSEKLSYSFDRYSTEGLAIYAELHGIEPCIAPKNEADATRYLAGFNRRMEKPIQEKLGRDFPEGYIKKYFQDGWLDFTREQPTKCPIHLQKMIETVIPLEVVTSSSMPHSPFEWEIAGAALFPFPGSTKKVDFSWFRRPKRARVYVCQDCTKAEKEWWIANPPQK